MKIQFPDIKIPDKVAKVAGKQLLVLQKHSPHIMFGLGVAGVVTSAVLACRATLKVNDKLDEIKTDVERIKHDEFQPYLSHHRSVSKKTNDRPQLAMAYARGTFEIARLYAPSVLIGGASIALLTGSHVSMTKRNNALMAAYATLNQAFNDYRAKIREELGEDKERELYRKSQINLVENPDGTRSIVAKGDSEQYSRVFDESNRNWVPNAESNRLFLEANQAAWDNHLKVHRHLFLNDVYKSLGFEPTKAGQMVGWVYPSDTGDNYVDFGIYQMSNADFAINGDRTVLLDFNVDGVIWHLID